MRGSDSLDSRQPFSSAGLFLVETGAEAGFASYPELYAVVGSRVPDLQNRILQGSTSPGSYLSAGLPNVKGMFEIDGTLTPGNSFFGDTYQKASGAFYIPFTYLQTGLPNQNNRFALAGGLGFDASHFDPIYGNSSTVQPPAYTTRFLIRAKS